jgi:hypothetical protein
MKSVFAVLVLLLSAIPSEAQSLDRLKDRVNGFWDKRIAGDNQAAANFVEQSSRPVFQKLFEPPTKKITVTGFTFTQDPKRVTVNIKATSVLPIGEVERNFGEVWVWANGNWFVHLDPAPAANSLLSMSNNRSTSETREFKILDTKLDLGSHVQGEVISGTVRFAARKNEIRNIFSGGMAGLSVKRFQWLDDNGGTLEFLFDTALETENFERTLSFAGLFDNGVQVRADVPVIARIQGRIKFAMSNSQPLDLTRAGRVELEVQNKWTSPFSVISVEPSNNRFKLESEFQPRVLNPGESIRVGVAYQASPEPIQTALKVTLSEVLPVSEVYVPVDIALPRSKPVPLVDPEVVDRILSQTPRPIPQ